MNKNKFFLLLCLAIIAIHFSACSDDTEIGYNLLEDEVLEVRYAEDVDIQARVVDNAPIQTYSLGNTPLSHYYLGQLRDPIMGTIRSSVYFTPSLNISPFGAVTAPQYSGGRFDSIVLTLAFDTTTFIGDAREEHNIEVFELMEPIDGDTLYSDDAFPVFPEPVGTKNGVVLERIDSILIPDLITDTTFNTVYNVIRIPLKAQLGRKLFIDSLAHLSNAALRDVFPGLYIASDVDNNLFGLRNTCFVTIYYHDNLGIFREFLYFLGPPPQGNPQNLYLPSSPRFEHDFSGTPLESIINVPVAQDDYLYLGGLSGTDVELDFSDIHRFDNQLINHATLEFYLVEDLDRDTFLYPIANELALLKKTSSGFENIEDLNIALQVVNAQRYFGGYREWDTGFNIFKYSMNITSHLVDVINGRADDIVFLRVFNKAVNPKSTILYGPNHLNYRVRLKLTYTTP